MAPHPQPDSRAPKIGPQAAAVVTGSFLSGAMASLSTMVTPLFLDTDNEPAQLLRHWARLYHYGHLALPALSVATCGLYGYTALSKRASGRANWRRYAVAGAMTIAMVPFTWYVMVPTNNTLFRLEASARKSESGSGSLAELSVIQELVVRWAWLHIGRSVFPLIGAIMGLSGLVQELGR
ncbi:uncharacterized protein BCR38DRAFT_333493 [Pseudomassariella vexata]|uniref:DUF1772-domain-containing protein n=1 Tax=Pseudomassariella vexata TaxID=1141098 RepID=A0A1Y2EDI4_9PEZI|nr:uncharacterized protein BCR38DRAFT_333493 [Pseudomassariella vexata]ORY69643.1 hypothetical protein BCR38DRAFT_333493 [Pseudomassariella vexata]